MRGLRTVRNWQKVGGGGGHRQLFRYEEAEVKISKRHINKIQQRRLTREENCKRIEL